jgi:hypothetical protein
MAAHVAIRVQRNRRVLQVEPQAVVPSSAEAQGKEAPYSCPSWNDSMGIAAEGILFSMVSARNFLSAKTKNQRQKWKAVFNMVTRSDFVPLLKKG